jgi:hypothetical protein
MDTQKQLEGLEGLNKRNMVIAERDSLAEKIESEQRFAPHGPHMITLMKWWDSFHNDKSNHVVFDAEGIEY